MRFIIAIAGFAMIVGACSLSFAEEEPKAKGLDVVTDTAIALIHKTNAFFQGNLAWTMTPEKDKYERDYTIDALGRKVPRSTLGKYDSGNRN